MNKDIHNSHVSRKKIFVMLYACVRGSLTIFTTFTYRYQHIEKKRTRSDENFTLPLTLTSQTAEGHEEKVERGSIEEFQDKIFIVGSVYEILKY